MKNKFKTVFVYPDAIELEKISKIKYFPVDYRPVLPLGILSVMTNCETVTVLIDARVDHPDNSELIRRITSHRPDLVAFGGTMFGWRQASNISWALGKMGISTVYGGPNASSRPEKHVNYFDYVISGRAEKIFNDFVAELRKGNISMKIPGLSYKGCISTEKPCFDINSILPADRSIVNIKDYNTGNESDYSGNYDIVFTSYGCPYKCRFCASQYIWKNEYQLIDIDTIKNEIEYIVKKLGSSSVFFEDDNFSSHKARLEKICSIMSRYDIPWRCKGRVNALDRETVKMLKAGGCSYIRCGFESINDETLEYINKGFCFDDIMKAVEILDSSGIKWGGPLLSGFPNEKEKHIIATANFIKKMNEKGCSGFGRVPFRFLGIPVSELYNVIIEEDLIYYDWSDGEVLVPNTRYLGSDEVDNIIDSILTV